MASKKLAKVNELTLDVLKPHNPSIIELGTFVKKVKGVKKVSIIVNDVDEKTEKVKLSILGKDLNIDKIRKKIEDFGASVHSIDKVIID